jgi:hypothetical protein
MCTSLLAKDKQTKTQTPWPLVRKQTGKVISVLKALCHDNMYGNESAVASILDITILDIIHHPLPSRWMQSLSLNIRYNTNKIYKANATKTTNES